jgi:hypothetical protein
MLLAIFMAAALGGQEGVSHLNAEATAGASNQATVPPALVIVAPFAVAPAPVPPPSPPPSTQAPERWLLMKSLQGTWYGSVLDSERMQVTGWTEGSFTASSVARDNLPMGFNYRANEFLVQQNWLRVDRAVVTSATTEPSFGLRFDTILPGTDYRFTLARGIWDSQLTNWRGQPSLYGIDPIQAYLEAYFPTVGRGLDLKFGRFFALYGVETNDAISNALCSHAYTFIYDPFTHTGLLATLRLTDAWTVQAGLVLGSDVFIDSADEPTFVGSVKWTRSDQRDSVLASVIVGSGRFNQEKNFHNPEVFDLVYIHLVYIHQVNPRLTYNFETLVGYTTNVPDIGTAHWIGMINYLTYNFNARLGGTTRLELFDDEQGQRTGFKGLYAALTAGVSFKPRKSIIFRPELRYDYNNESRPFEGKHGLLTATTDLILRW